MRRAALLTLAILLVVPPGADARGPKAASPSPVAQDKSVDPVILTGSQFPTWSAGPDPTLREPQIANDPQHRQSECYRPGANPYDPSDNGDHSCYQSSRLPRNPIEGKPVGRILGYKWNPNANDPHNGRRGKFVQIPLQVDELFTRYLTNNASGFAFYSGADAHNTYAFDREGFRFSDNDPGDVCKPIPREDPAGSGQRPPTTPDPVRGLDDDDEIVFMQRDTDERAPLDAPRPAGIEEMYEIAVTDTSTGDVRFAYVMLAAPDGPAPAFTAENSPYVRYARDTGPNRLGADLFVYSQSSYSNYGAAPKGPYCDPVTGEPVRKSDGTLDIKQRRPLDTAWITTPRYAFRYDGRWLMTQLRVASSDVAPGTSPDAYGPDLIDRWKARAFQQDPSSETPCCGYEEEDTNWGGSSILMGERAGPVRVIRETWGADSSTNNARREVFYRDLFVWGDALRVHPIPPLDGIYSQWDYNAGVVTRYYNPVVRDGVAVDGRNDEVFGNLDDPCNRRYDGRNSTIDETFRQAYRAAGLCSLPYHQSVDVSDPTMSGVQALNWEQLSGAFGGVVTRTVIRDHTPGGDAQTLFAVPYYRDDSCFDDGTGTDPGPKINLRSGNEPATILGADGVTYQRKCWAPGDPIDPSFQAVPDREGDERYFQGSIGTHGVHLLFVAESDNGYLTAPVTEIVTEQRIVVLPPSVAQTNVGERYGRFHEFPLVARAVRR